MRIPLDALCRTLEEVNHLRRSADPARRRDWDRLERVCDSLFDAGSFLATYGSLAPGAAHHDLLDTVAGSWSHGYVRGELCAEGWGATLGYPALRWVPDGPRVPVHVLHAPKLAEHWARLDRFEGEDYCRILVPVESDSEVVTVANLYERR
ncbi:MAG TPA: gamma-glutamylcyclotransferase [Gemmatimonadales bacterium]